MTLSDLHSSIHVSLRLGLQQETADFMDLRTTIRA